MTSLIAACITHLLFRSDNDNSGQRRGFKAILQCFYPNTTGRSGVLSNRFFKLHLEITRILSGIHLMAASTSATVQDMMICVSERGGERERVGKRYDIW